jgi:ATP/ADP translocase
MRIPCAVLLSAFFSKLPESYWTAISPIIVMHSDVSRTVKASGQRLWAFGVVVTPTVLVCALLGFEEAARLKTSANRHGIGRVLTVF